MIYYDIKVIYYDIIEIYDIIVAQGSRCQAIGLGAAGPSRPRRGLRRPARGRAAGPSQPDSEAAQPVSYHCCVTAVRVRIWPADRAVVTQACGPSDSEFGRDRLGHTHLLPAGGPFKSSSNPSSCCKQELPKQRHGLSRLWHCGISLEMTAAGAIAWLSLSPSG
jgi:hypothetical protein